MKFFPYCLFGHIAIHQYPTCQDDPHLSTRYHARCTECGKCELCGKKVKIAAITNDETWISLKEYAERVKHTYEIGFHEGYSKGRTDKYPIPIQMNQMDPVLFVSPSAPTEVIKAAYTALAKRYHPDAGGSNKQMKDLNVAYDKLMKGRK